MHAPPEQRPGPGAEHAPGSTGTPDVVSVPRPVDGGAAGNTGRSDVSELLDVLLDDFRFAELAALALVLDLPDEAARGRVRRLARLGVRLLDLDAEDFGALRGLPDTVRVEVVNAQFPQLADATERGSLNSLVPIYRLMLEALDVRWRRRETLHVVMLLHLVAEYLPLLAWEPVLGHAGDPERLLPLVDVAGSRWGRGRSPECDHNRAYAKAAEQALLIGRRGDRANPEEWDDYLNRQHSRVAHALGRCASHCRTPCAVVTSIPPEEFDELRLRMRLSTTYYGSPAVALRHHAPAGHFFGVPSPTEVTQAWAATRRKLARVWPGGDDLLADDLVRRGEALAGFTAFVSAAAGRPVLPADVLHGVRDAIRAELAPLL